MDKYDALSLVAVILMVGLTSYLCAYYGDPVVALHASIHIEHGFQSEAAK